MVRAKKETARFLQVLEYFDGRQAILLERSADVKLVAVAIDKNGYDNPFFAASISFEQRERYRRGYVDFRSLFALPRWKEWYIFDLHGADLQAVELHKTVKDREAEESYIPASGFFAYDHSEQIISEISPNLGYTKILHRRNLVSSGLHAIL
jgi:hypothetical protein